MKNIYQREINKRNSSNKTDENIEISFDSLVKYFPLFGIFTLLCGGTYLGCYYAYFGIDIFSYIETGEILNQYLSYLIVFLLSMVVYLSACIIVTKFIFYLLIKIPKKVVPKVNMPEEILFFVPGALIYFFIQVIIIDEDTLDVYSLKILSIGIFIVFCAYTGVFIILLASNNITKKILTIFLFLLSTMLLTFNVYDSLLSAAELFENGEEQTQFSFTYNNKTITSDSSLIFIGNTNKYIFILDESTLTKQIYPMDKVEDLILK